MKFSIAQQRLVVVAVSLLWCVALIIYRISLASDMLAIGLLWNLVLAAVPLVWSAGFQTAMKRKTPILPAFYFFLWLLFLPNAPYILTDLIHLSSRPHVSLWFVLAMILSCAGVGTMLGYLSLIGVHNAVEEKFGKTIGWATAAGSLMLCGFGIYLGRFLRWNSWDAFSHPLQLAKAIGGRIINAGEHPHPIAVTIIYGSGLIIGYLFLRVVAVAVLEPTPKDTSDA